MHQSSPTSLKFKKINLPNSSVKYYQVYLDHQQAKIIKSGISSIKLNFICTPRTNYEAHSIKSQLR